MSYHLAQLNIAKFKLPMEDPANADFVNNLDRVNAQADQTKGFVWRLQGAGNNASDLKAFDDPNIITNMSVWTDLNALTHFVYKNKAHRNIMQRRREWFENIRLYMVLWWIEAGHRPPIEEAKARLELLKKQGPSPLAFTFGHPFSEDGSPLGPTREKCA